MRLFHREKILKRVKIRGVWHYSFQDDRESEELDTSDEENDEDEDDPTLTTYTFLSKNPNTEDVLNFLNLGSKQHYLIKGAIQSGKTNVMIGAAYFSAMLGISTIILVQQYIKDVKQIKKRIEQYWNRYKSYMESQGFNPIFNLKNPLEIQPNSFKKSEKFVEAISGDKPNIIICMRNSPRIRQLLKIVNTVKNYKLNLVIDEIDTVYKSGKNCKVRPSVDSLMKISRAIVGVSATLFDVIIPKDTPFSTNRKTFVMDFPPNYKGFGSLIHNKLDDDIGKTVGCKKLEQLYIDLLNQPLQILKNGDKHPLNMLSKFTRLNEDQNDYQDWFKTHKILRKYTTLVYNCEGSRFYSPNIKSNSIHIDGFPLIVKDSKGYFNISRDIPIFEIYEWMRDPTKGGGVNVFPYIQTFAGDMASRGTSFVSTKNDWHLTDEFLLLSDTTDAANSIQALRILGIYKDDIVLTLHTTQKCYDNCKKGLDLQEEIIKQAKEMEGEHPIPELLKDMKIKEEIIPNIVVSGMSFKRMTTVIKIIHDEQHITGLEVVYIIYRNTISNEEYKKKFDRFVNQIDESVGTGVWEYRKTIISSLATNQDDNQAWKTFIENIIKLSKARKVDQNFDDTIPGLLVKRTLDANNRTTYKVRYNEE